MRKLPNRKWSSPERELHFLLYLSAPVYSFTFPQPVNPSPALFEKTNFPHKRNTPAFSHASRSASGQSPACTSPIWHFCNNSIHKRD